MKGVCTVSHCEEIVVRLTVRSPVISRQEHIIMYIPGSASSNTCLFICVYISKCASWHRKILPAYVAVRMVTTGASGVFVPVNGKILGTSRRGMQQANAGSTRARSGLRLHPCASCIWLTSPALLVSKMVLTLCNLRWWFFFQQLE